MKRSKKYIAWDKVSPLSKYLAMALFVALPFMGFILGMRYQRMIAILQSVPITTSKQESKNDIKKNNNVPNAGMFIPTMDGKASEKSVMYINWDYGYLFLIPGDWKTDLDDNRMKIDRLGCIGCAGGFYGVSMTYYTNDKKLPLREFIYQKDRSIRSDKIELFKTNNPKMVVYIDRQTPGAGSGQTAYLLEKNTEAIVELYCGACSNAEINTIVSTFDFDTERNQEVSGVNFL